MNNNLFNLINDYTSNLEEENKRIKKLLVYLEERIISLNQLYEGKDNLITYECGVLLEMIQEYIDDEED